MTRTYCIYLFLLLATAGGYQAAMAGESSFVERVKNHNERFDNRAVPLARQVTEDSVLAKDEYQGGPFRVLSRKKHIERFACSRCHTGKPVTARQGLEETHGNILLNHGLSGQALSCIDCHHKEDRDFLEDKKGRKIDFDHSYQLCGQCHFRQKRDWLGGGHGKRVANWGGERVIYNCTTCHDPHSPRFAKRFPATYSVPLD